MRFRRFCIGFWCGFLWLLLAGMIIVSLYLQYHHLNQGYQRAYEQACATVDWEEVLSLEDRLFLSPSAQQTLVSVPFFRAVLVINAQGTVLQSIPPLHTGHHFNRERFVHSSLHIISQALDPEEEFSLVLLTAPLSFWDYLWKRWKIIGIWWGVAGGVGGLFLSLFLFLVTTPIHRHIVSVAAKISGKKGAIKEGLLLSCTGRFMEELKESKQAIRTVRHSLKKIEKNYGDS